MTTLMIQSPLQGNWIIITLEFGSNSITIQFPDLMEAPPLLVLISLEEVTLTMCEHTKEVKFEIAHLVWVDA